MPAKNVKSRLSAELEGRLCCPICKALIKRVDNGFQCQDAQCNAVFPVLNGVPILIDEKNSLFAISDYVNKKDVFFKKHNWFKAALSRIIPSIGVNIAGRKNYRKMKQMLLERSRKPRVLVLGGGILGDGMKEMLDAGIELVETDVALVQRTQIVVDAHSIPFADSVFDGVIAQAVLEHVVDPQKCVSEIHRVLKPEGIVYVEVPFMQQVHAGAYDFCRFSHIGLLRLMRQFNEISSGTCVGVGSSLAWSVQYFLLAFFTNNVARKCVQIFCSLALFPLKYFDFFLTNTPSTYDAASGYFFLGCRSNCCIRDKEVITKYRGCF